MSRRGKKRFKRHKSFKKIENKDPSRLLKKFFFWFISYVLLITLFTILFEKTQIYANKIGFYLIMGFILVLCSRIIYSSWKKKKFMLKGVLIWGLLYALVFGLVDYLLTSLFTIQINPSYDKYIFIAIFAVLFTIIIMFLRRMKIPKGSKRSRNVFMRAPSQILSGIILLVIGILFFRFSHVIFLQWFAWPEGMAWSWLIGLGFLIAGFLTIVAWWRNNVSMFTTRHTVRWRH